MIAVKNPEVGHITNVNVMRCLILTDRKILVARNPKLRNLLEDGEYIPSLGQLNLMAHYMDELNKAFAYVSASPLSSAWYWSSTEYSQSNAWYVSFSNGGTSSNGKYSSIRVRAVAAFTFKL